MLNNCKSEILFIFSSSPNSLIIPSFMRCQTTQKAHFVPADFLGKIMIQLMLKTRDSAFEIITIGCMCGGVGVRCRSQSMKVSNILMGINTDFNNATVGHWRFPFDNNISIRCYRSSYTSPSFFF